MTDRQKFSTFLMYGGGVAMALGSFLPWMKATIPLAGTVTSSGVDNGGDGIVIILAAIAVAALCWWLTRAAPWGAALAVLIVAGVAALVLAYDVHDIAGRFDDINSGSINVSTQYGGGLYLCGLGVLAAFVGGCVTITEKA